MTTAIVKGGKFLFIVQSIFRVLPINPYVAAFSGLLAGLFTERAYVLLENLVNKAASGIGKEALGENDTEAPKPVTETVEEAEPATTNGAPTEIKATHAASKPAKGNGATNGKKPAPAS